MVAVAIATAALTALAVTTSVQGSDALSTVALVLAIIAFTIQIFLFVVQSQFATEQRVRSEQVHTQTRSLLAEVRTTGQATQALVSQQFNKLLEAFVTGAARTAQETKVDPENFERRLLANIVSAAQASSPSSVTPQRPPTTAVRRPVDDGAPAAAARDAARERVRTAAAGRTRPNRLKSFPEQEAGGDAVATLGKLSPSERLRLQRLGRDEISSTEDGTYVGLYWTPVDTELEQQSLVTPARVDVGQDYRTVSRLTEQGVNVARLLTATGEIPSWAKEVVSVEPPDTGVGVGDDDIPF